MKKRIVALTVTGNSGDSSPGKPRDGGGGAGIKREVYVYCSQLKQCHGRSTEKI